MPTPASVGRFLDFVSTFDDFHFDSFAKTGRTAHFILRADVLTPILEKLACPPDSDDDTIHKSIADMLYFYLNCKTNKSISDKLFAKLSGDTKPTPAVADADKIKERIGTAFRNSTLDEDRRTFVQFVSEHSRDVLVERYKFTGLGEVLLKNVRDTKAQPDFQFKPFPKQGRKGIGGRKRISDDPEKNAALLDLYEEHSEIASKRLRQVQTLHDEPTRTLTLPPTPLGDIARSRGICSRKAFAADFSRRDAFQFSKRLTDYCKYCDRLRILLLRSVAMCARILLRNPAADEALRALDERPTNISSLFAHAGVRQLLSPADYDLCEKFTLKTEFLEHHRRTKDRQRASHNGHVAGALAKLHKWCIVLYDYKESVQIGHGGIDLDGNYYKTTSVSVHVFTVWVTGVPEPAYVVLLSRVLEHSAEVSVYCLNRVMDIIATRLKEHWGQVTHVRYWSDCGSHYVNHVMTWACLIWQGNLNPEKNFEKNIFERKHGKAECDRVNQRLDAYLRTYLDNTQERRVDTVDDLKKCYLERHESVNKSRESKGQNPIQLWVEAYTVADLRGAMAGKEAVVTDLQCMYCIRRPKGRWAKLYNAVYSDMEEGYVGKDCLLEYKLEGVVKDPEKDYREAREVKPSGIFFFKKLHTRRLNTLRFLGKTGLPADLRDDFVRNLFDPSPRIVHHAVTMPAAVARRRKLCETLVEEPFRMVYLKSQQDGYWVLAQLQGENRVKGDVDVEVYDVCGAEVVSCTASSLVDLACSDYPTLIFLRPSVGKHMHTSGNDLWGTDSWAECTDPSCMKWRFVSAEGRESLQEVPFLCFGGCDTPLSPLEAARQ